MKFGYKKVYFLKLLPMFYSIKVNFANIWLLNTCSENEDQLKRSTFRNYYISPMYSIKVVAIYTLPILGRASSAI